MFPEFYFNTISYFYPETVEYLLWNIQSLRFPYIFSDPNSAAYLISIITFLYIQLESNWSFLVFSLLISVVSVILTQSRGGLICEAIIFLFFIFSNLSPKKILGIALIIILILFAFWYLMGDFISDFYEVSLSRIDSEDGDVGGGRVGKYFYFIKNINFYPFGFGYTLFREGIEFRPHSDLIRLNLSYGIFSIPLFFYLFPNKSKSQITFLFIILIPFLINSLIDDFRLLGLAILVSIVISQLDKLKINRINT
jgi:hypothetical protein